MESIFKNYCYNFKMLFYSSTLSSDKSRNSILFFRKDFVIQKVIVSEFNFGRHGRTVQRRVTVIFKFPGHPQKLIQNNNWYTPVYIQIFSFLFRVRIKNPSTSKQFEFGIKFAVELKKQHNNISTWFCWNFGLKNIKKKEIPRPENIFLSGFEPAPFKFFNPIQILTTIKSLYKHPIMSNSKTAHKSSKILPN